MIELPRIEESRAHRLVDIMRVLRPEPAEGGPVALHGESVIRIVAGELDRPPDDHVAGAPIEARPAMAHEGAQEGAQQVLEAVALAEDAGFLEGGARREGLEGLDEPVGVEPFQELVDGPGAALDVGAQAIAVPLVPEAQGRHIDLQVLAAMGEGQRLHVPVRVRDGHDRVAGAEIDADGQIVGRGHGDLGGRAEGRTVYTPRLPKPSGNVGKAAFPIGTATPALWTGR